MKALLIILILCGGGYFWYTQMRVPEQRRQACVKEMDAQMQGTSMNAIDSNGYCSCLVDIDYQKKLKAGDNHVNLVKEMRPCVDQFIKPPLFQVCKDNDAETRRSGYSLDCGCFASNIADTIIEKQKIHKQNLSQQEIEKAFRSCARRR